MKPFKPTDEYNNIFFKNKSSENDFKHYDAFF